MVRHWPEKPSTTGVTATASLSVLLDPRARALQCIRSSRLLEPRSRHLWLRRISIVSLIHYSGKNAVFLPLERALPLVAACLDDEREQVQKAVGWVLREPGNAYPNELRASLKNTQPRSAPSRSLARSSASTPPRRPNCGRFALPHVHACSVP